MFALQVPSLPIHSNATSQGYHFENDFATKISHWHLLQSLGKINEHGIVDFSLKSFTTKNFFLHFCTSASIADYTESEKHYISKSPMPQASTKTNLYLKFKNPTSTNLRLTVVYMQHRQFAVNKDRLCFKNWDTGKDNMRRCI